MECLKGKANCENPELEVLGRCENQLTFTKGKAVKKARFTVTEQETEHLRVKILTNDGGKACINSLKMTLVS